MSRELEDKQEGEPDEDRGELIKCYGHIAGKRVVVLFNTGSTEDVISSSVVESARLKKSPMTALPASGFSAGMDTSFTKECKDVKLKIQQVEFKRDFLVAKLVACDIILGMKWFHKFQPVVNWSRHTLSIHDNVSQPVMIRGQAGIPSLPLISHIQAKRELRPGAQAAIIYVNPKAQDLGIPQRYGELFDRFNDLFLQDDLPPALPPERPEDHVIDLVDGAEPVTKFPYRLNKVHEEELERQLGELLDRRFIRPSVSPFAAPILFVRKKDGSSRLCVDYRALNKMTVKNKFPMPRIDYILERLNGAKVFSKIDLKSGYHQVRVAKGHIYKTAFRTERGHYEFIVMPFGLTSAPGTFNRMMMRIFIDLVGKCVFIFLDDILIFSATWEQHEQDIEKVLQRLAENRLYIAAKKSEFFLTEVSYLRYVISADGIKLDPEKVSEVRNWELP